MTITLGRPLVPVSDRKWRLAWRAVAVLLVVTQSLTIRQLFDNRLREKRASLAVDMSAFSACTKVNFDFSSDRSFALMLGNWMADWRFEPWLSQHIPADTLMWVPSNGLPQQFNGTQIPWADVTARSSCTVMRGLWGPITQEELHRSLPGAPFKACTNGAEWVFSLGIDCESAFPGVKSSVAY